MKYIILLLLFPVLATAQKIEVDTQDPIGKECFVLGLGRILETKNLTSEQKKKITEADAPTN